MRTILRFCWENGAAYSWFYRLSIARILFSELSYQKSFNPLVTKSLSILYLLRPSLPLSHLSGLESSQFILSTGFLEEMCS